MSYKESFPWEKYIEFAEELLNLSKNFHKQLQAIDRECIERNVISRAYYGVFCISRNYAYDKNWIQSKNEEDYNYHIIIQKIFKDPKENIDISSLDSCSISIMKKIGKKLEKMRRARNFADYEDNYSYYISSNYKRHSEKRIEYAKYIKKNINKLT